MSQHSSSASNPDQNTVLRHLEETEALLQGHFLLSSGLHSPNYLQCARVLQHPDRAEMLGRAIADLYRYDKVEVVVAPAIGGIVIGYEVARALGVRSLFTEREEGAMRFRRGFTLNPGERVLVVEDVVTTGGSTRETLDAVLGAGGIVVGAASILDRSGGKADVGYPRTALATLEVETYAADTCPLCEEGTPAVKPGSRK